jgi:hypothetical protein
LCCQYYGISPKFLTEEYYYRGCFNAAKRYNDKVLCDARLTERAGNRRHYKKLEAGIKKNITLTNLFILLL